MSTIYIAGLGAGATAALPYGTLQLLQAGYPVLLRTERHPVVDELRASGLSFTSLDFYYETAQDFSEVYERIAQHVLRVADGAKAVVYAVPGHPAVAEKSVRLLADLAAGRGHVIEWGPGQSFLDDLLLRLHVDPVDGLLMVDAADLQVRDLKPQMHTVIVQMYNRDRAAEVKAALAQVYGDEYEVVVARAIAVPGEESVTRVPVYELDRDLTIDHLTTLYVPPLTLREERLAEFDELVSIVAALRSPDTGCPWDLEQTHESLRRYAIEEAYEVVDAIDEGDFDHLAEELGDLLLQVLLHSQIGEEEGYFQIRDVIRVLAEKLIRRHPHVFGDQVVTGTADVLANWQRIKDEEKVNRQEPVQQPSLLGEVKASLPPFSESIQLQTKAAEIGFDFATVSEALVKVREETEEVAEAASKEEQFAEIGDLLFSAVNTARHLGVDPEAALRSANARFRQRFTSVERQLDERGIDPKEATLDLLEDFWQNAKEKMNS
ncbi:MAG: nucleoside triphosphate pyrophosphohydrolase [Firmicutes bacterium]|nr:nucleoside triphosphate pyrophosphohydrolase [Bacillota bacterium]